METPAPPPGSTTSPAVAPVTVNRVSNMDSISILSQSLGVNGALLILGMLLFHLLWSMNRFAGLLRPRLSLDGNDGDGVDDRRRPPIPGRRWLNKILWMRGEELIDTVGLDAYFYLRYQTLAIVYFTVIMALCCSILIPYHMSADPNRRLIEFHFSEMTLGHVPNGDHGLWLHVALAYVQAVVLVLIMVREAGKYAAASARYHLDSTRSIQVNALPSDLQNDEAWSALVQRRAGTDSILDTHVLRKANGDPTPVAFATMASVEGSARLLATLNGRHRRLRAIRAPLPEGIAWDNLAQTSGPVLARRMVTGAVVILMIVFWTVPLTGIASMSVWLPSGVAWAGVLPAWAFLLLLTVTPRLLDRLSVYERHATHAARHRSVFGKFCWILFLDFFLFGTVSRGLLSTIWKAAAEPFYFSDLLASTVPEQSTIIIIYLLSFTCLTLPFVDLNRIVAAVIFIVKRGETPSSLPLFPYGEYYSYQVLHILIGYTYATLAPIMLPFVLFYFIVAAVVAKVQFCYVYGRREGSGTLFPAVLTRTIRSALVGCAVLMSVLLSKQGTFPALTLIPILVVLIVTDVFVRKRCQSARLIDLESEPGSSLGVDTEAYRPPWMKSTDASGRTSGTRTAGIEAWMKSTDVSGRSSGTRTAGIEA